MGNIKGHELIILKKEKQEKLSHTSDLHTEMRKSLQCIALWVIILCINTVLILEASRIGLTVLFLWVFLHNHTLYKPGPKVPNMIQIAKYVTINQNQKITALFLLFFFSPNSYIFIKNRIKSMLQSLHFSKYLL